MKLKDVLVKEVKELNDEEKAFVTLNWDILNDEYRAKFVSLTPDEESKKPDEGIDENTLKGLVAKATAEHVSEAAEEITKQLLAQFKGNLEKERAKVQANGGLRVSGSKENDEITRKYLRALMANDVKTLREIGQKAIDTSSDGSGADLGFTIPEPLANEIIRLESVGYGRARELFGYNLITQGNSKRITALGSVISVFWTDEGEKKGASQPSFDIVTLTLKKLAVIVPWTDEAAEDKGIDLTGLVAKLIREDIDKEVDLQFFMGDGSVWTGIFIDTTIPADELGSGDTGAELSPEAIVGLSDNAPLGIDSRYIMSRSVLSKVRLLKDGDGRYLFNPLGGEAFGTLNGYPVDIVEADPTYASTLTGTNKPIMMFGDFKRGVDYGEKSDIRLKLLDQATITDVDGSTTINLAEQDMTAMRAVQRVGMKVTLDSAMRRLVTGDAS